MQYALLFYNPPHTLIPASEREATIAKMLAEMGAWRDELQRAGVRGTLRGARIARALARRAREPGRGGGSRSRTRGGPRAPRRARGGDAAPRLAGYPPYHAARADLLRRAGRNEEAAAAYRLALDLCRGEPERRLLAGRLAGLALQS